MRMTEADVLFVLLLAALVASIVLLLASGASAGRILADIEYQRAAGINGIRRIQAIINARTHGNRIFLGLAFLVICILALTDVPLGVRSWTSRILILSTLVVFTVSSVLDWFDHRRQVHLLLKRGAHNCEHSKEAGPAGPAGPAAKETT
jgi:sterol desaturase/sphingolipid hydroxylase (fatty acid hydroxylase superfamily)